tara:strand:+ start:186 stop:425 length:240 start_codon:yes stop_codon:yes gene_type:complete
MELLSLQYLLVDQAEEQVKDNLQADQEIHLLFLHLKVLMLVVVIQTQAAAEVVAATWALVVEVVEIMEEQVVLLEVFQK